MSHTKIVFLILLLLALLYGLSLAIGTHQGAGDKSDLHPPAWLKGLADRFGPGFNLEAIRDNHVSAKNHTIAVAQGQSVSILIPGNQERKAQRLKLANNVTDCTIQYVDAYRPPHEDPPKPQERFCQATADPVAITDQGGVLTIACRSKNTDCVLKVK